MNIQNSIKNISGVITVQIEGFFTERFINLCKINNVKIWDIRNVVKGVIRFKMNLGEFKKLKFIAKKTKCKVKIKEKKGLYFTLFKYRKRKIIFILAFLLILFSIIFSNFIWNINISGNESITKEQVLTSLEKSGIYIGKCKIGLDKKQVVNDLRVQMSDLSWIGIQIEGTTATIKIVEKTKLKDEYIQNNVPGDIIASKSGIITKIVPENGTAKYKEGSYIEKDSVAIEGCIYSKFLEPQIVVAKGILKANVEYEFKKEYEYLEILKEYTKKKIYTVGITINSKENMLNYLNKSKKYDITKSSKKINIFGKEISFDLYTCLEYVEVQKENTKEMLIEKLQNERDTYLSKQILPNAKNALLVSQDEVIEDKEGGIISTVKYVVNEQIGDFVERVN